MRITFRMDDFKKVCERAAVIIKNSFAMELNCLHINTEDGIVLISAITSDTRVDIWLDASIGESGKCSIPLDSVKKLFNVSGFCTMTANDGKVRVENGKKKSSVSCYKYEKENLPEFPKDASSILRWDESEFVKILGYMNPFLHDESNLLLSCYNIDICKRRITTCDGHSLAIRNIPECYIQRDDDPFNLNISGSLYNHMKKIQCKTKGVEHPIWLSHVKTDKHDYMIITGKDYEYITQCVDGDYFDVDKVINVDTNVVVSADEEEMFSVAKEYYGIIKNDKTPMLVNFDKANDKMDTVVSVGGFATSDTITSRITSGGSWYFGCHPYYVKAIYSVFTGEKLKSYLHFSHKFTGCVKTPIIVEECHSIDKDKDWKFILMPVMVSPESAQKIMESV